MLGIGALGQFPLGGGPANIANLPTTSWFSPLSEPVRFKVNKRLAVAINNQTFTFDPIPLVSFSYFNPLSEPRRFKVGLAIRDQPFFSFQPTPIIDISWFGVLSEPVRQKRRLREGLQSFEPNKNISPVVSFGWYSSLSEPRRFKRRLMEGLQQFSVAALRPTILLDWFATLSEPVRLKRGLRKELQSILARAEFIPINYPALLDVTERRDFFLGVLYQFNIPASAYVDIIENDPRHLGNVGVIENMARAAIVSLNEPQAIPATGMPVSVAGARVAIITGP